MDDAAGDAGGRHRACSSADGRRRKLPMDAVRNIQTVNIDNCIPGFGNGYISVRNLDKYELAGAIFGCINSTMEECLSKQLFGLPFAHFPFVKNIEPGLPVFLFNNCDRTLYGIYESESYGQLDIDPYAWCEGGAERTAFPAQIRVRIREQCEPLLEREFKKIIAENYYTSQNFWFELDFSQTRCLIALFKPYSPPRMPVAPLTQTSQLQPLLAPKRKRLEDLKLASSGNKSIVLSLNREEIDCDRSSKELPSAPADIDYPEQASDQEELTEGEVHGNLDQQPVEKEYKNVVFKLQRFSANRKSNLPYNGIRNNTRSCVLEDLHTRNGQILDNNTLAERESGFNLYHGNVITKSHLLEASTKEEQRISLTCFDGKSNRNTREVLESCSLDKQGNDPAAADLFHGNIELLETIRELEVRTATLEKQQVEYYKETQRLSALLRNAGQVIQLLNARLMDVELKMGTSMLLDDRKENFVGQCLDSENLIYLIGGSNGSEHLSALESFSPSLDILKPLKSMSSARSYASAVVLEGALYALGGNDRSSWYNTVECYDRRRGEWTACPPMLHEKSSLACATLNNKIYAIGGGDRFGCFSAVDTFDPVLGKWISWKSMFHKRFAPTAAELNGALYAVGGFDGQDYLTSAERLDPREFYWTKLPNMTTRRGCHSMAVFNEKLYVMGGYDGKNMVSSVEVYDPRASAWMACDPMNHNRGYAAAAVLGDSLFIIGGRDGENIIETIECYKGGRWNRTHVKAVGRRCFHSAVVL